MDAAAQQRSANQAASALKRDGNGLRMGRRKSLIAPKSWCLSLVPPDQQKRRAALSVGRKTAKQGCRASGQLRRNADAARSASIVAATVASFVWCRELLGFAQGE